MIFVLEVPYKANSIIALCIDTNIDIVKGIHTLNNISEIIA